MDSAQAEFFLESYDTDAVIHIVVPDDIVRHRVLARRLCSGCGLDYNLVDHRPNVEDQCDECGARLVTRADDNEEALDSRLEEYHARTEPVLDLFRRKELVVDVDGTQSPVDVQNEIRNRLNLPAYAPQETAVV